MSVGNQSQQSKTNLVEPHVVLENHVARSRMISGN